MDMAYHRARPFERVRATVMARSSRRTPSQRNRSASGLTQPLRGDRRRDPIVIDLFRVQVSRDWRFTVSALDGVEPSLDGPTIERARSIGEVYARREVEIPKAQEHQISEQEVLDYVRRFDVLSKGAGFSARFDRILRRVEGDEDYSGRWPIPT